MAKKKTFARATKSGLKVKNPQRCRVEVYRLDQPHGAGGKGAWFWRLKSSNGRIMADGAEGYVRKQYAIHSAEKVLDLVASEAPIFIQVIDPDEPDVEPAPDPTFPPDGGPVEHPHVVLSLTAGSVQGGHTVTGLVTHTPTTGLDLVIKLDSSDPAVAAVDHEVILPRGSQSVSFPIITATVSQDTDVTIRARHILASTAVLRVLK